MAAESEINLLKAAEAAATALSLEPLCCHINISCNKLVFSSPHAASTRPFSGCAAFCQRISIEKF
jgi:hypothetical protein